MMSAVLIKFFLYSYRFFIYPLLLFFAYIISFFGNEKLKKIFSMRMPRGDYHPWFDLPRMQKPIWIHCSSGEFEYAKPIIDRLKQKYPQQKILVTYFSPSYEKSIKNYPGVDMSCPLPWDFPGVMRSFLRHHLPKALLIARTDLWPEMLYQSRQMEIPICLFSVTQKPPLQWQKILNPFYEFLYSFITIIFCVSAKDKEVLLDKGALLVRAIGDTRYDQVIKRLQSSKMTSQLKEGLLFKKNIPTFICGSTWEEDEKIILLALRPLLLQQKVRLILVPHEPTDQHIQSLKGDLVALDLDYQLYSEAQVWADQAVLLVNTTGILAELYKFADIAFVGGSFKKSVHSVMEPLAAACLCLVGPYCKNNREALDFSEIPLPETQLKMVNIVNSVSSFQLTAESAVHAVSSPTYQRKIISDQVQMRTGSSEIVVQWVEEMIKDGP